MYLESISRGLNLNNCPAVLVEWRQLVISKQEVGSSMLGEILTRKGGKRAKLPFRGTTFQIYSTAITMKYI